MTSDSTHRRTFESRVRLAPVLAVLGALVALGASASGLTHGVKSPGGALIYGLTAGCLLAAAAALWRGSSRGQFAAWVMGLAAAAALHAFRQLHVSPAAEAANIALNYTVLAAIVVPMVAGLRITSPAKALLMGGSLALTLIGWEEYALLQSFQIKDETLHDVHWMGDGWHHERHPTMGLVYRPWGWMKAWYPTNVREYFEIETPNDALDMRSFRLQVEPGVQVQLTRPERRDQLVALAYTSAAPDARPPVAIYARDSVVPGESYTVTFQARARSGQSVRAELAQTDHKQYKILAHAQREVTANWQDVSLEAQAVEYGGELHLKLLPTAPQAPLEVQNIQVSGPRLKPPPRERFAVSYAFNGEGFRDREWRLEPPEGVTRIAMLGDSFTVGYGVHAWDLASRRLEQELGADKFEVMNCATVGFSSRQERACFQAVVAKYKPRFVLLMMVANDPVSMEEENEMGSAHLFKKMEQSSGLTREAYRRRWEAIEEIKQQYQERCVPEVRGLADDCRRAGAELLVVYYRFSDEANWLKLVRDMEQALAADKIPTHDLFPALRADHDFDSLKVHPLDAHPNEVANRLAAADLAKKLRELGWLDNNYRSPASSDTDAPAAEASTAASGAP